MTNDVIALRLIQEVVIVKSYFCTSCTPAGFKLTKLFGIDDFSAAKDFGKVFIIIIYCFYNYYKRAFRGNKLPLPITVQSIKNFEKQMDPFFVVMKIKIFIFMVFFKPMKFQ